LQPLMKDTTRRFLLVASGAAGLVAVCGVLFGYFVGLPSALHFLLHQFTTVQVRPLITIQSYMQFVALYLFGSALMFQLPLILLLINRIKPLKPGGLLKYERHLIAVSFVIAFIMNPTPNIMSQLIVVLPIIITYQLGIVMLWLVNRSGAPAELQQLREQDAQKQTERAERELRPLKLPAIEPARPAIIVLDDEEVPIMPVPTITAETTPARHTAPIERPRSYTTSRRSYLPLRSQLVQ